MLLNLKSQISNLVICLASMLLASVSSLSVAYQILPSPNYSTITVSDSFAENWLKPFDNYGDLIINTAGKLDNVGWLTNYSNLINYGSYINAFGPGDDDFSDLYNVNTVTNYGYLNNYASLAQASTGIFYNYGTLDNNYGAGAAGFIRNSGALYNLGILNNLAGAIYNDYSGVVVNSGTLNHGANINNYGTLENSGYWNNIGSRYIPNYGEIINTGTFTNTYALLNAVKVDNSGTISEGPGHAGYGSYQQYVGETINNGIIEMTTIEILGGILKGTGTLIGSVIIGPGATVIPGLSPGTLNIDGDLHSNGNYVFEIAGLNSGQYDVLDIDGNAFFTGGNFKFDFIDGFIPSAGDHWDFLVADSLNGFDTVGFTFAGLGDGLGIDLNNEGGKISLTVITAVPEPETYAMLLAGLGLMGFVAQRKKQKEVA